MPHYFRAHRNTCVILCISALVARLRTSRKLNKNFNLKMLTTLQQNFNLQVLTTLLLPLPLLPPPPEIVTPTSRICYAGETKMTQMTAQTINFFGEQIEIWRSIVTTLPRITDEWCLNAQPRMRFQYSNRE